MQTAFATLALLNGVFAGSLLGSTSYNCYTDTYDDLTANAVPLLSPITTYHGLTYEGFVVASVTEGLGGVVPVSCWVVQWPGEPDAN